MTSRPADPSTKPSQASVGLVYATALILSACSLLYELLIAQALTLTAGSMVIWYSLIVGTYLAAMGVGAVMYGKSPPPDSWTALYQIEIVLSIVGALAIVLLHLAHSIHLDRHVRGVGGQSTFIFFTLAFLITFVIGILTGMELPLLIRIGNQVAAPSNVTNRVLGWDYIGALVGGVTFPVFLLPHLELLAIGFATSVVNLIVAAFVVLRFLPRNRSSMLRFAASAGLGLLLVLGLMNEGSIQQYFLKKYYYYIEAAKSQANFFAPIADVPDVLRVSSPYQKIDLVHDPVRFGFNALSDAYSTKFAEHPEVPRDRFLFLNGDIQVNSNFEEIYHEWFAHVPVLVHGEVPERVLVMGAGDGLLLRELLKYKQIPSITHVDIDHRLVDLAKVDPVLTVMNQNALDDPRVETIFGDAYQYIRNSSETFDAIYLDFPLVMDYNLSKLYSREFYHFVRARLAEGGYAVLDAPGLSYISTRHGDGRRYRAHGGSWHIHYPTMRTGGFETVIPYYTFLEKENPRAYEILEGSYRIEGIGDDAKSPEEKEAVRKKWKSNFLDRYLNWVNQGFIMLRKGTDDSPGEFWDLGIELHALNEERFQLAFPRVSSKEDTVDLARVNSIMRPTLPRGRVFYIRSPW